MLPFNRRRSPSPGPRGFWGDASYNHRPRYNDEHCTQGRPQDHEFVNTYRYNDMRRDSIEDEQYYMVSL